MKARILIMLFSLFLVSNKVQSGELQLIGGIGKPINDAIVDEQGNLFLAVGQKIIKRNRNNCLYEEYAGTGEAGAPLIESVEELNGSDALSVPINPRALSMGPNNEIYVLNAGDTIYIQKITPDRKLFYVAGTGASSPSRSTPPPDGTDVSNSPITGNFEDVSLDVTFAIDRNSRIYILDSSSNLYAIEPDGTFRQVPLFEETIRGAIQRFDSRIHQIRSREDGSLLLLCDNEIKQVDPVGDGFVRTVVSDFDTQFGRSEFVNLPPNGFIRYDHFLNTIVFQNHETLIPIPLVENATTYDFQFVYDGNHDHLYFWSGNKNFGIGNSLFSLGKNEHVLWRMPDLTQVLNAAVMEWKAHNE